MISFDPPSPTGVIWMRFFRGINITGRYDITHARKMYFECHKTVPPLLPVQNAPPTPPPVKLRVSQEITP